MARDFGGKPWGLAHHVCLKSAVERIAPEQVFFYYEFEPRGPWWELSRELVTPVRIEAPREIFGRPLDHVAHRADVVRLQKLIEHGGIYLDADVLVQRNFDDLLDHNTVLGQEGDSERVGLANAVILAEPQSPFLRRWLEEYRFFQGGPPGTEFWNAHSVWLPKKLACAHPSEVTVLPPTAFYWPLWTQEDLKWMFASNTPIPNTGNYANHLWENYAWKYLDGLTPRHVRSIDTNFNGWARPLLAGLTDDFGALTRRERLQKRGQRALRSIRAKKSNAKSAMGTLGAWAESAMANVQTRHSEDPDVIRKGPFRTIIDELDRARVLRRAMRLRDALRVMRPPKTPQEILVYLKMINRHVCIRSETTDLKCLEKVFVYDEYKLPFELHPRLIVDAGANVGMATLYFAHKYPEAQVVAIEPEYSNYEMLRRNCGGLPNVTTIQGALWPVNCPLEIEDKTTEAWTFRITDHSSGSGNTVVPAVTITDILERVQAKRIDLLKLDIEGSELQLFSNGGEQWIDRVQAIAIELHDRIRPGCARAFYSVLTAKEFVQEVRGENVFVKIVDPGN